MGTPSGEGGWILYLAKWYDDDDDNDNDRVSESGRHRASGLVLLLLPETLVYIPLSEVTVAHDGAGKSTECRRSINYEQLVSDKTRYQPMPCHVQRALSFDSENFRPNDYRYAVSAVSGL